MPRKITFEPTSGGFVFNAASNTTSHATRYARRSKSQTASVLQATPSALFAPCLDNSLEWNLAHLAAVRGRSAFLSNALIAKDDKTVASANRQNLAFIAVMAKDKAGRTTLALAIDAESGSTIKVRAGDLRRLFSFRRF